MVDELCFSIDDPVNIMSPYWQNNSCSPFLAPEAICTLGNMAQYAINISSADQVAVGLRFAQENNIRLTIKNTGHDFLGRSAGEGSLALWMRNLQEITFLDYDSSQYSGPAARFGAGVQNAAVYQATSEQGLRVVGGSCPTVGVTGGYIQGGGHGPLGSTYGLGADQALEFTVVTANGTQLTASSTHHSDLFWALSGGGSGNFAVVTSVTVKAHTDGPVAGASFSFSKSSDEGQYWSAVSDWLKHLLVLDRVPRLNTLWTMDDNEFSLDFATLPGGSSADMLTALDPFFQELDKLNVTLATNETRVSPNFESHYLHYASTNYATSNSVGSRLMQRDTVQEHLPQLVDVIRGIVSSNATPSIVVNGIGNNLTHAATGVTEGANAVLPAWRDSLFHLTIGVSFAGDAGWGEMSKVQTLLNTWQDQLRDLTPGGGAYMNEATYDNVHWKEDYYGDNYDRLLAVKEKYDPDYLLWGDVAVGSDVYWETAEEGRLCRV